MMNETWSLTSLKAQIWKQILNGDGELIKTEISKLSGYKRKQELSSVATKFWIPSEEVTIIEKEILNLLHEDCTWTTIKTDLIKTKETYSTYWTLDIDELQRNQFLIAQEIFQLLSEYFDKVLPQEKKKFISLLLKHPGIDQTDEYFWRVAQFYSKKVEENITSVISEITEVIQKPDTQKKLTKKGKEELTRKSFVEEVREIIEKYNTAISNLNVDSNEYTDTTTNTDATIEKTYISIFRPGRKRRDTIYGDIFWLPKQYIPHIKCFDVHVIDILLQIQSTDKADIALIKKLNDDLHIAINLYLPEDLRKKEKTTPNIGITWVNVQWNVSPAILHTIEEDNKRKKAKYQNNPTEIKQAETTNTLEELVGKEMEVREFISKAWLDGYTEIEKCIETQKAIPALFFKTVPKGDKVLNFFTVGEENKWGGQRAYICAGVLTESSMTFKPNTIYPLVLTRLGKYAATNPKRQTHQVDWMLKDMYDKDPKYKTNTLWDTAVFKTFKKKN